METIVEELNKLVRTALENAGLSGILRGFEDVQVTKNPEHGDFQSNHAFRIGKMKRTNPRDVANQVKDAFPEHPAIAAIEVAGPGFLNFRLSDEWLAQKCQAQVNDEHRGIVQSGQGKTMVIDYSSPNVAKRMHIGHMRSTIIGNAIDRMYRSAGWKVVADNHIGDWGTQFGKLMVAWREDCNEENFAIDPIGELERLYVSFGKDVSEEDLEQRMEMARQETAKLQSGDEENTRLWKMFIDVSLKEFDSVYQRLGIKFDEVLGESFYNPVLPSVVAELKKHEIAIDSDGAVVVSFPKGSKPKMLKDSVLVIQKKDGAYLYGTTDLATCDHRLNTWAPAEMIYVTDMRQQLHFQQIFHAWNQLRTKRGETDETRQLPTMKHVWFGMLKLPEGAMSTRQGNVIRLVDLLDEAVMRAKAVADEKSSAMSEEERQKVAEAVGVSAIRYSDLSQNPQTDVTFAWDRILSLEGNTAPFLMYSYARARGIQRKGGIENPTVEDLQILDGLERTLVLFLLRFPIVFALAQENSKPNWLCDYLFELSSTFNRFYFSNPVLTAEDEAVKNSRLALVEATLRVLEKGFSALGITSLARM